MWEEAFTVAINGSHGDGEIVVLFSGHERTPAGHHVGPRVLDYFLVHYIMSGKGWCRASGDKQHLKAGDSFFQFPGTLSEYCSDETDPWRYCWIAFRGALAREWTEMLGVSPEQPALFSERNRKLLKLFQSVYRSLRSNDGISSDVQAGAYLRLLFSEWIRSRLPAPQPQRRMTQAEIQVERALQWFTLQYAQPKAIAKLAKDLGYHRTYFSKLFRKTVGMSPQQFLLHIRMERAKELLRQPLTVEQVASSVGISDPLYFSRQFKRRYGISPTEFRQE
ncbi:AraC family transcriptional regulator [Paenibacillus alkalitolerans]|uniref:AraC family transcriptional regulator n=1 Tax=Paenibacillus alkalitolerans TaxID=2799335 RepID=UPI0018F6F8F4|nr:AraC family transcriptional regulator [Paenibacillus alkalitolerans]